VFIKIEKLLAFSEVDNLANVVLNLKADIKWTLSGLTIPKE
jgi:hypothetical protein